MNLTWLTFSLEVVTTTLGIGLTLSPSAWAKEYSWEGFGSSDRGYTYDIELNDCLSPSRYSGRSRSHWGECGTLRLADTRIIDGSHFRVGSLRGLRIRGGVASGIQFSERDLAGARFEKTNLASSKFRNAKLQQALFMRTFMPSTDFTGANLAGARFQNSDLRYTKFRNANLRGTQFTALPDYLKDIDWSGAEFDERTVLPFDCATAIEKRMVWRGANTWACDSSHPVAISPSLEFQAEFPGFLLSARPDGTEIFLHQTDELKITPITRGLLPSEKRELVCTGLLGKCEINDDDLIEGLYEIRELAHPVIDWGLELFHAPHTEMERLKRARITGFFEIETAPTYSGLKHAIPAGLRDAARTEWARTQTHASDAPLPRVTFRSLLDEAAEINVNPDFLDPTSESLNFGCDLRYSKQTGARLPIRCHLTIDVFPSLQATRGWAEQWTNALIRQAFAKTFSLQLRLNSHAHSLMEGNLLIPIWIKNINHTTLTTKNFRRLQ